MTRQEYKLKGIGKRAYSLEQIAQIRDAYNTGLSTRDIEAKFNISKTYVHKLCRDIARNPSAANQLKFPPKSKHWRSSRQAARKKMERYLGYKLDSSFHVHHVNGDYTDNRLENLEVIEAKEHSRLHWYLHPIVYSKSGWRHNEETKKRIGEANALDPQVQQRIVELYKQDVIITSICKELGVSIPTVHRYARMAGLRRQA